MVAILPNKTVRNVTRRLGAAVAVKDDPFDRTQEVQDWGGRYWVYGFDVGELEGPDGRAAEAILQGLGGRAQPFLFADPQIANPAAVGLPVVNGAGQTGGTLVTDGWTPSLTVLQAGQFFSLGIEGTTRLYMATANAVSDGSGNATLTFVPDLRISPSDNDAVEVAAPQVLLRLTDPVPIGVQPAQLYTFSVSAREAL